MEKDMVSIVIPPYNRKGLLIECLNSIFKQDYKKKENNNLSLHTWLQYGNKYGIRSQDNS